jgi:hypothetical protein
MRLLLAHAVLGDMYAARAHTLRALVLASLAGASCEPVLSMNL